ncbi:intraflagellar transport protein 25 homolog isoform X3 [Ovis canadensis]|uniref:intraflagellar transport protein 25 homolog isoform X3 n=1 Tax=Ovis canadensis TaxID=37174 RepID=UPI003750CC81
MSGYCEETRGEEAEDGGRVLRGPGWWKPDADTAFIVTLHLYIALCPITSRSSRKIKHFKMRKVDLCLSSEGTEVILATSSDEKHPPENMIDGNPETFWTTTGMFPQEFIICFHKHVRIEKLVIQSYFAWNQVLLLGLMGGEYGLTVSSTVSFSETANLKPFQST